jgi:hypothetical protein
MPSGGRVALDGLASRAALAGLLALVLGGVIVLPAMAPDAAGLAGGEPAAEVVVDAVASTAGEAASLTAAEATVSTGGELARSVVKADSYGAQTVPGSPLDAARRAAERTQFRGTLSVQWTDQRGPHSAQLDVRGTGSAVYIDGPKAMVATSDQRLVLQSSGWSLVAAGDPSVMGLAPPMSGKYAISSEPGPLVAERPTVLVDIRTLLGTTDERLYLDDDTGLVLRREQLDNGEPVRVVTFLSIDISAGTYQPTPVVHHDNRPRRLQPLAMAAPYRAPSQLAAGYVLVGVLRRQGVVQAVYSDAVHTLSVFEQGGALNVGALPSPGQVVPLGSVRGVRYSWPGGQLVTWQSGPLMYTAVGDGPVSDILAAATSFPSARSLSAAQRIRLTCRRLLEDLTGRG